MTNKTENKNSRFADDNTFAPRVVTKGDGKNPLDEVTAENQNRKDTRDKMVEQNQKMQDKSAK